MSDYFFKRFYTDVKDTSWPDANNYADFLQLPATIQSECINEHNFLERKNEISDSKYWTHHNSHSIGYRYKNLIFVPVFKCGKTYYKNFFYYQLGWEEINIWDIDWNNHIGFGLIMHPLTRRIKGITQTLTESYNYDYDKILEVLKTPGFQNFIQSINISDIHTTPYSISFKQLLYKINWFPLEKGSTLDLKIHMMNFLKYHGVTVNIPVDEKNLNESSDKKLAVYNKLFELYMESNQDEINSERYFLFADDLNFYHNLLDQFKLNNQL